MTEEPTRKYSLWAVVDERDELVGVVRAEDAANAMSEAGFAFGYSSNAFANGCYVAPAKVEWDRPK